MNHVDPRLKQLQVPRGPKQAGALNLASNILLHPDLEKLQREALAEVDPWGVQGYPNIHALHEAFCGQVGRDPSNIVCAAGSDELVKMLFICLRPVGGFILQTPCYGQWYSALAQEPVATWAFSNERQGFDTSELIGLMNARRSSVVILSNPNSPLGVVVPEDDVQEILAAAHAHDHLVVVDAAFEAFSEVRCTHDERLLIVRSLSKSFGTPGLRLGYLEGNAALIADFRKYNSASNVSTASWLAGSRLVARLSAFEKIWRDVRRWRTQFAESLRSLGAIVLPAHANFVTVRTEGPEQADWLETALSSHGILTRNISAMYGAMGFWRCGVPAPSDSERVVQVLAASLDAYRARCLKAERY